MRITPIEIQQHQFKTRLMGYDTASVDHFLEVVADEMERIHRQNQGLKEELARTRSQLEEMRAREKTLQETLITTKQVCDDLREAAKKESEIIVAEGQLQSERLLRAAEDRRLALIREIQEMKGQKLAFESGLRALLENHLKLLDLAVIPVSGETSLRLQSRAEGQLSLSAAELIEDDDLPEDGR